MCPLFNPQSFVSRDETKLSFTTTNCAHEPIILTSFQLPPFRLVIDQSYKKDQKGFPIPPLSMGGPEENSLNTSPA